MGNEQGKKKIKNKHQEAEGQDNFEDQQRPRTKSTLGKLYTTVENPSLSPSDFELLKVVGQGSYGKVCQVKFKKNQQIYAMKIIKKETVFSKGQAEHTATERRILEQIDHPFIVSLRFAFQTPDKLYLVLDYFNGGELFFHLKETRGFDINRAKFYAAEVLLALEHLHSLDVIYRDLKPENVLLDEEGHIKLTDFGLAKEGIDLPNGTKTFCGTPEYLAPEVLQGYAYGKPVDVWSFGSFLYEIVLARPPFYHSNRQEMYKRILTMQPRFPQSIPSDFKQLVLQILNKNPELRIKIEQIKQHPFFGNID